MVPFRHRQVEKTNFSIQIRDLKQSELVVFQGADELRVPSVLPTAWKKHDASGEGGRHPRLRSRPLERGRSWEDALRDGLWCWLPEEGVDASHSKSV